MIDQTTLARPYAKAVFEIAKQQGTYAEWSALLETLSFVAENDLVKKRVQDTTLPPQEVGNFYKEVTKTILTEAGKNLIQILSFKKRLALLPQINKLFSAFRLEAENLLAVELATAIPLTETQKSVFSSFLEKRFGKKIIMNTVLDESLMGGYRIKAGDLVMDGSLKGSLDQLRTAMGG